MINKISCPFCGFKLAMGDKTKVDIPAMVPVLHLKCKKCGKTVPVGIKMHGA